MFDWLKRPRDADPGPEIYWVVGDGTGVGKTSISCGLLRVLNDAGRPAVGFKPFGGVRLFGRIDFIVENYPRFGRTLFGNDALRLAESSPLTDESMVEIVAPIHYLFYTAFRTTLMARAGASRLGNVEFFRHPRLEALSTRKDIARIVDELLPPPDTATPMTADLIDRRGDLAADKCNRSYDYLRTLGPQAMVFEGAGPFLPTWPGASAPDHVVVVADGTATLFRNVRASRRLAARIPDMPEALKLARFLRRHVTDRRTVPVWITESAGREATADEIARDLLGR